MMYIINHKNRFTNYSNIDIPVHVHFLSLNYVHKMLHYLQVKLSSLKA